jgi:hypothetical protein
VIAGGEITLPGSTFAISVDSLLITNTAATATAVDLYACGHLVSADDAVNRFVDSYTIPAGDTLYVFEGNSIELNGGETIQAKADNADYLRAFSFEHVKLVDG